MREKVIVGVLLVAKSSGWRVGPRWWEQDFLVKNTPVPISGMFKKSEYVGTVECGETLYDVLHNKFLLAPTEFCEEVPRFLVIAEKKREHKKFYEQYSFRALAEKKDDYKKFVLFDSVWR